jgi:hypothetical protein
MSRKVEKGVEMYILYGAFQGTSAQHFLFFFCAFTLSMHKLVALGVLLHAVLCYCNYYVPVNGILTFIFSNNITFFNITILKLLLISDASS